MTTPPNLATADPAQFAAQAETVARRTGVDIRLLDQLPELVAVSRLLDTIWKPTSGGTQMPPENLRALAHVGNYVAGAYLDNDLVGASIAFFGTPGELSLHSHITGVVERAQGRGTGYAMKLHQRAWAIRAGAKRVTWTFDPVVRRNAHFNLAKLGAVPVDYLIDFYGSADDTINAGQGSDRVLASWDIASSQIPTRYAPPPSGTWCVGVRARGRIPEVAPEHALASAAHVVVETPPDVEALRRSDPAAALQWRHATRAVLGELVSDGAHFLGFSRDGAYHYERTSR